jgi:hypothetical protein
MYLFKDKRDRGCNTSVMWPIYYRPGGLFWGVSRFSVSVCGESGLAWEGVFHAILSQ